MLRGVVDEFGLPPEPDYRGKVVTRVLGPPIVVGPKAAPIIAAEPEPAPVIVADPPERETVRGEAEVGRGPRATRSAGSGRKKRPPSG